MTKKAVQRGQGVGSGAEGRTSKAPGLKPHLPPHAPCAKLHADLKIGIIGLGYVGLPLAVEFGKKFPTVGFDINKARVAELSSGKDHTLECSAEELESAKLLKFSTDNSELITCNFYIVTVPTPIDDHKNPDLTPLVKASETLGKVISKGDIVVFESTVYPGATEEVCIPVIERVSGLKYICSEDRRQTTDDGPQAFDGLKPNAQSLTPSPNSMLHAPCSAPEPSGFFAGYSPERINPGDKEHRLPTIRKITSGSTPEAAERVDAVYRSIITAGTYKASSIRVAEAAKVIENTQRDINIALVNELALIFNRLGIDTEEVLLAAGTKWNFLPFRPGLVGGHCIGVDPYYLTYKAQEAGYHPEVILAGRRLNDNMGVYVATQTVKQMLRKKIHIDGARVLVLGLTFKENCPDLRNTRVVDIIKELKTYGAQVDVYDPWIDVDEAEREYDIRPVKRPAKGKYDAIIAAVKHHQFASMTVAQVRALCKARSVVYDIKRVLPPGAADGVL